MLQLIDYCLASPFILGIMTIQVSLGDDMLDTAFPALIVGSLVTKVIRLGERGLLVSGLRYWSDFNWECVP